MSTPMWSRRTAMLVGSAAVLSACVAPRSRSAVAISVPGALGAVTLDRAPQRVICLGYGADAALALGVVPVAIARATTPSGLQPWVQRRLARGPDPTPVLLSTTTGPRYEQIAALAPDVILAVNDYSLAQQYSTLTQIAPVLSYVQAPNQDPWQLTTRRIGVALARGGSAAQLVADTEARLAAAAASSGLRGRSFTFASVSVGGQFSVKNDPQDVLVRTLAEVGLALAAPVQGLPGAGTPGLAAISAERTDLLEADVVMITFASAAQRAAVESNPLFTNLRAVRDRRYVALDQADAQALAFPSALAIGHILERVVPRLAATR